MCPEASPVHRTAARKPRADGVQARERILLAALGLFVDKGYGGASVREIAQAAEANVAAIAYYFGDKAGLYRAVLYEPVYGAAGPLEAPDAAADLGTALRGFMRACLQPLALGEAALLSVRLRLREAFEPTGMLARDRDGREQAHQWLLALAMRRLGLAQPDHELQALASAIFGLMAWPYRGREHMRAVAPQSAGALLDGDAVVDAWVTRLAAYAEALIEAEAARRGVPPLPPSPDSERPS
jgi:TetR/AcrR family transcriptional regulator, regulator of cefoperazone and chloramphenicol sensitivity